MRIEVLGVRRGVAALLLSTVIQIVAVPARAQSRLVTGLRNCVDSAAGCGLSARPVSQLPGQSEIQRLAPGGIVQVVRTRAGYFIATLDRDHPLLRVDRTGRVEPVGRAGEGPGEFVGPLALLHWPGDSVAVFDRALARLTFVNDAGRSVGSRHVPYQTFGLVPIDHGRAVMSGVVRAPSAIGLPLHLIDSIGVISRSFGIPEKNYTEHKSAMLLYFLTSAGNRLWAFRRAGSYEWQQWNSALTGVTTWVRHPSWYPEYRELRTPTPTLPPYPYLTDVVMVGDSLVWVAIAVPSRNWARGLGPEAAIEGTRLHPVKDVGLVFDTRFELVDLRSGVVRGSIQLPGFFPFFAAPGVAMRQVHDPDGALSAELVELIPSGG